MNFESVVTPDSYQPRWEIYYNGSQFIFEDAADRNNIAKGRLITFRHECFANLSHLFIDTQYRALGKHRGLRVPEDCVRSLEDRLRERGILVVVASFKKPETIAFLLTQGYEFAAQSKNGLGIEYIRSKDEEGEYIVTAEEFATQRGVLEDGLMSKIAMLIKDI